MEELVSNVIDANLDRAREGLRVIETIARFILKNKKLTEELKDLRHSIMLAVRRLPVDIDRLAVQREKDVGAKTYLKTEAERENYIDIAKASFVRVEEASRVLEEFSKLWNKKAGRKFKRLRFKIYKLEKEVIMDLEVRFTVLPKNELYVIIDRNFAKVKNYVRMARKVIKGGAKIIQLREKEMSTRRLISIARKLRKLTKKAGVMFIVNDRVDVALSVGADGVHLGKDDLPIKLARKLLGRKIVGFSSHSLKQAIKAEKEGASYISFGPVFATTSKPNLKPVGLDLISKVKKAVGIPLVAIGGINPNNIDKVVKAGADNVAAISAVIGSTNIKSATKKLREKLKS